MYNNCEYLLGKNIAQLSLAEKLKYVSETIIHIYRVSKMLQK